MYTVLDRTHTGQCSITTIFSIINLYQYSTTQPTKNKKHPTSNKNPPVHISFANISITIRGIGPRSSRLQAKNPLPKHGYSRTLTAPHLPMRTSCDQPQLQSTGTSRTYTSIHVQICNSYQKATKTNHPLQSRTSKTFFFFVFFPDPSLPPFLALPSNKLSPAISDRGGLCSLIPTHSLSSNYSMQKLCITKTATVLPSSKKRKKKKTSHDLLVTSARRGTGTIPAESSHGWDMSQRGCAGKQASRSRKRKKE